MTPEEAIRRIENHIEVHSRKEPHFAIRIIEALKMAISALKKQIPKKPTPHIVDGEKIKIGNGYWCKGTTIYRCPNCEDFISRMYKYCHKCGQALDWSDTE